MEEVNRGDCGLQRYCGASRFKSLRSADPSGFQEEKDCTKYDNPPVAQLFTRVFNSATYVNVRSNPGSGSPCGTW